MQTNAYLRSKGKTRLGQIPKPVQLSRSPEDEDYYGMPVANPAQPYVDLTRQTKENVKDAAKPILWIEDGELVGAIPDIARTAKEEISDFADSASDIIDFLPDFLVPDPSSDPPTRVSKGYHHDHVTLLPAPKREQSVNMFTAIQENPTQVIGYVHDESQFVSDNSKIILAESLLVGAFDVMHLLTPDWPTSGSKSEKLKLIREGFRNADTTEYFGNKTFTEIAILLNDAKAYANNTSLSQKPIIGFFSQNTPTFLWPWTTSVDPDDPTKGGRRYTAVDFANMPLFPGKVGSAIKLPFEIISGKQYDKVGTLPAYGAWGDIMLGIPSILLVAGAVTFGAPVVGKAVKDAGSIAKTAATVPITWGKAIFVDMPLNIITSIQDKVRDFTKPRMKYKEGRYQPATIEAVIPPAHKIKMFLKQNKGKIAAGGAGFLGLAALSIVANRKFGVVQNTKNFVADQTYQAKNTQYIPTYHPEYNNWNANRQVQNRQNR